MAGAVGGAATGVVLAATGNVALAGAAGGAATELTNQTWNYVASGGKEGFDLGAVAVAGAAGAALGKGGQLLGKVAAPLLSKAAGAARGRP